MTWLRREPGETQSFVRLLTTALPVNSYYAGKNYKYILQLEGHNRSYKSGDYTVPPQRVQVQATRRSNRGQFLCTQDHEGRACQGLEETRRKTGSLGETRRVCWWIDFQQPALVRNRHRSPRESPYLTRTRLVFAHTLHTNFLSRVCAYVQLIYNHSSCPTGSAVHASGLRWAEWNHNVGTGLRKQPRLRGFVEAHS